MSETAAAVSPVHQDARPDSGFFRGLLGRYLSLAEAQRFVSDLAAITTVAADPSPPHLEVCRDPGDDYLVALARATEAEAIVTGDLDLLSIEQPDPAVLTPRDVVDRLKR